MARVRLREGVLAPPDVPVIVHHVVASCSNVDIGRAIAELAIDRYGLRADALLGDGRFVRARRNYFQRNYPIHLQRMRGVASAFGLRPDDDRFDFSVLRTGTGQTSSGGLIGLATYAPPWTTETGHGLLSRSAELPDPSSGRLELCLMEWHPLGRAYASIALHADDLLSGTVHGINAPGLAVSAVASTDAIRDSGAKEPRAPGIRALRASGLHELQLMRFVLDTCATVDDAQAALLGARDFAMVRPARYLIADRDGRSFVYEASATRHAQHIIDGAAESQLISSGTLDRPHAQRWRCVADQQNWSLEVSFGPGTSALSKDIIGFPELWSDPSADRGVGQDCDIRIIAAI